MAQVMARWALADERRKDESIPLAIRKGEDWTITRCGGMYDGLDMALAILRGEAHAKTI
jgi:hypothetical protein